MSLFHGCGTALVTPFSADGSVDFDAYRTLVARQISGGVDFLVPLATTGETPALSEEEKKALLRIAGEQAAASGRRIPILAGCGSNSVNGTLANIKALEPCLDMVDAWLVVVPFYNKPTQEGMYRYYKAIAESAGKPIVIYNVPGRTGANMSAATCIRLACEVPGIIGTKEASGKYDQIAEILKGAPAGFSVLSGDDDMTLSIMEIGAKGVISVAANIVPDKLSAMTAAALKGDFEEARRIDSCLKPLYKACFVESNPIPAKAALNGLGLCGKTMRLPLTEASPETCEMMRIVLDQLAD